MSESITEINFDNMVPQSRSEEILLSILNGVDYDEQPQSRLEALLIELYKKFKEIAENNGLKPLVVQALPDVGDEKYMYFVPNSGSGGDVYDEYIWIAEDEAFERVGSTGVDLSEYAKKPVLSTTLTLSADNWMDGEQTVAITLDTSKLNRVIPTASEVQEWADYGVYAYAETAEGITFKCDTAPVEALTFKILSQEVTVNA